MAIPEFDAKPQPQRRRSEQQRPKKLFRFAAIMPEHKTIIAWVSLAGVIVAAWGIWLNNQTSTQQFRATNRPRIAPPGIEVVSPLTCDPLTQGAIRLRATLYNGGNATASDVFPLPQLHLVAMGDAATFVTDHMKPDCRDLVPKAGGAPAFQLVPGARLRPELNMVVSSSTRPIILTSWQAFLVNCVWYFDKNKEPHQSCDLRRFVTSDGANLFTCLPARPITGRALT
jgi:hypothetical protein